MISPIFHLILHWEKEVSETLQDFTNSSSREWQNGRSHPGLSDLELLLLALYMYEGALTFPG